MRQKTVAPEKINQWEQFRAAARISVPFLKVLLEESAFRSNAGAGFCSVRVRNKEYFTVELGKHMRAARIRKHKRAKPARLWMQGQ